MTLGSMAVEDDGEKVKLTTYVCGKDLHELMKIAIYGYPSSAKRRKVECALAAFAANPFNAGNKDSFLHLFTKLFKMTKSYKKRSDEQNVHIAEIQVELLKTDYLQAVEKNPNVRLTHPDFHAYAWDVLSAVHKLKVSERERRHLLLAGDHRSYEPEIIEETSAPVVP